MRAARYGAADEASLRAVLERAQGVEAQPLFGVSYAASVTCVCEAHECCVESPVDLFDGYFPPCAVEFGAAVAWPCGGGYHRAAADGVVCAWVEKQ